MAGACAGVVGTVPSSADAGEAVAGDAWGVNLPSAEAERGLGKPGTAEVDPATPSADAATEATALVVGGVKVPSNSASTAASATRSRARVNMANTSSSDSDSGPSRARSSVTVRGNSVE